MTTIHFDKYVRFGAYHWNECDRRYFNLAYNPALDARYQLVFEKVRQLGGQRLLDVGCGDGCLLGRLAPLVKYAAGIDSEPAGIAFARERLKQVSNCELIHCACYDLPFPNGSFDVAISSDVIEHLEDPGQHLREIGRVLTPSGYLVLTTPKWRADRKWDARHIKEYSPEELSALLADCFGSVESNYFWPLRWSKFYATRLGWRLMKWLAIACYNPFLKSSPQPRGYGQMLAVCRPRSDATTRNLHSIF